MIQCRVLVALAVSAVAAAAPACSSSDDPASIEHAADAGFDSGEPDVVNAEDADAGPPDVAPEASVWQSGSIRVVEQPDSQWHVAEEGGDVIARLDGVDIALLIDPTNSDFDNRYAGVYVLDHGTLRFVGTYNGFDCSMFVPDRAWVNQTDVSVTAAGSALTVEMTEGSLLEMTDAQFPSSEPFRWTSTWTVDVGGLRVQSSGLYYLLVPKTNCGLTIRGEGGVEVGSAQIDDTTTPYLEYFAGVRGIDIDSEPLGQLSVVTDAEVLQVEVPSYPNTTMFELDFDHSFKDHGQLDVHAELVMPVGL